jgi:hypothetical protein
VEGHTQEVRRSKVPEPKTRSNIPPGKDTRPFEVYDPTDPDAPVIRCWFRETAQGVQKQKGGNYIIRRRVVKR